MNKILIIQVNSADGIPSVTAEEAKVVLQGEVQDFWGWHFPVDYSDVTCVTRTTELSVSTIATHFWVMEYIINPYLAEHPEETYDFFITLLPPKAYGWSGLTAALGYMMIATPDPTKIFLVMAHEIGHAAYELGHSKRQFYTDCVYESNLQESGQDDIMGGALNSLSAYQLNELGIVNDAPSAATLYWLNAVDDDKSGISFAPGYWIHQRLANGRIHLVKDGIRQMRGDILPGEQSYITDNGFQITWGERVETYLSNGILIMYGYDLATLNPKSIPVFIREIENPCI